MRIHEGRALRDEQAICEGGESMECHAGSFAPTDMRVRVSRESSLSPAVRTRAQLPATLP